MAYNHTNKDEDYAGQEATLSGWGLIGLPQIYQSSKSFLWHEVLGIF